MSQIDWEQVRQELAETELWLKQKSSGELMYWEDLLKQRTQQMRQRHQEQTVETKAYLSCRICQESLLIPLQEVKNIQGFGQCVPLPLAPAEILGICHMQGRMVSVLDLGQILHLPSDPETESSSPGHRSYILLIRSSPLLGLRVDKVEEVLELEASLTRHLTPGLSPYLAGIAPQGQLIMDLQSLGTHPLLNTLDLSKELNTSL